MESTKYKKRIVDNLLRWHSIDPICEKYYHISPYAFCANNFVNAVDPKGDSVAVLIELMAL